MNNRYICVYEIEGKKEDEGTISFIFFDDFIQGLEWIEEYKLIYKIHSYSQEVMGFEKIYSDI